MFSAIIYFGTSVKSNLFYNKHACLLVFLQKTMQCTMHFNAPLHCLFLGQLSSSLFSYVIMAYGHNIRYILIFVGHTGSKRMLIQEHVVLVEITFTKMHTVITMLLFSKNDCSIPLTATISTVKTWLNIIKQITPLSTMLVIFAEPSSSLLRVTLLLKVIELKPQPWLEARCSGRND